MDGIQRRKLDTGLIELPEGGGESAEEDQSFQCLDGAVAYETIPSQEYVVNYNEEVDGIVVDYNIHDFLSLSPSLDVDDRELHIDAFQTLDYPAACTFVSFELWLKDNFRDNTIDGNQFSEYDPSIHDALQFDNQTAELTVISDNVFDYIAQIKANTVEGSYIYSNEFYIKSACGQESYKISIPDRIVQVIDHENPVLAIPVFEYRLHQCRIYSYDIYEDAGDWDPHEEFTAAGELHDDDSVAF